MRNIVVTIALLLLFSQSSHSDGIFNGGSGGGGSGPVTQTITAGTTPTSGITSGNLIGSASNLVTDSGVPYSTLTGGPFLPLAGGTMSGNIAMGGNAITGAASLAGVNGTGSNAAGTALPIIAGLSTGTGVAGLEQVMTGFASLSENATITATNASPTVITYTAHGLVPGASGRFSNSGGALPAGITAATDYFVCKDANLVVNTFDISLTFANGVCGALVNTTSTGSGTNTFTTNTTVQNPSSTVAAWGPSGLTGSQTTSALSITQILNTSGSPNVFSVSAINIASGGSCNLANLFAGAAGVTSEFSVSCSGNATVAGNITGASINTTVNAGSAANLGNLRNSSANAAAATVFNIGNNTSATEVSMTLNSSANVGGNGVNSFTINSAAGLWLQGGGVAVGAPSGGNEGSGTVNSAGAYYANGVKGVTCSGALTIIASVTITNGIITAASGTGGTCS